MPPQRMHSQSEQPLPWSEREVENLIHLLDEAVPVSRICMLLDRSPDDVEEKLKELAIRPSSQTL